jgi:hypothetical protein
MEQNFQTSFIPKKPIVQERASSSRPINIFMIGAILILIIVLLGTGALYFYQISLNKQIASMQASLTAAKDSFEPTKISELQLLDKRLRASTEILSNHITITPVFNELQNITMQTVRYTKFDYELGATSGANINIKMSGIATGYRSVALQSDLFNQDKNLINPVFSNLTVDNNGNVLFDLDFSVAPSFVNYQKSLLSSTQS